MRARKANKTWLVAGGIAAAVAASGGAFTNALTPSDADETVASGDVTVDGGTVLDVEYNLATAGGTTNVTSVEVLFDGVYDTAAGASDLFFGVYVDGTAFTCNSGAKVDGDTDGNYESTNVTCTHAGVDLSTIQDTHIVVNSEEPPAATEAV